LLETETDAIKANRILYDIVFSSSRMLLVTKGAEPKTSAETFTLFSEKFIDEGLVSDSFKDLIKIAETNSRADFSARKAEIIELGEAVITLYGGMDDSLQFKNQPIKKVEAKSQDAVQPTVISSSEVRVKDFRGVACPMNFVKTKIELSSLKSADLLEVWLDDGAPIQNVPGSVRNEGHEVISVTQVEDYWKVLIKKH